MTRLHELIGRYLGTDAEGDHRAGHLLARASNETAAVAAAEGARPASMS